jgi:hypothetical protein
VGGVPEEAATGTVADAYAEIRRIFGVPMVMLVYRALAMQPGRLEQAWDAISGNLACCETQRKAASLNPPEIGGAEPLPRAMVARANLDQAQLAGTLDAFDRSNRLNLIGLTSLLEGTPGNAAADHSQAPTARPGEMLPVADLASLPHATLDLLRDMSAPIVGQQQPILIPSLFRYFAHDEKLLRAIARSLAPLVASKDFPRAVAAITQDARDIARLLPHAVDRADDAGTRDITTRFLTALPAMIVTTTQLRIILGDLLREDEP